MVNINKNYQPLGYRSPRWFKSGKGISKNNTAKTFSNKNYANKKSGFHNGSR